MRERFEKALLELGANPANKGFVYTVTALELINNDNRNLDKITALYASVAMRHANSNGVRVERAIRHMIEQIANNTDARVVDKYFANFSHMTNSKFLAALYLSIRNRKDDKTTGNEDRCAKCGAVAGGELRVVSLKGITLCSHCIAEFMDEI